MPAGNKNWTQDVIGWNKGLYTSARRVEITARAVYTVYTTSMRSDYPYLFWNFGFYILNRSFAEMPLGLQKEVRHVSTGLSGGWSGWSRLYRFHHHGTEIGHPSTMIEPSKPLKLVYPARGVQRERQFPPV